MCGCAVKPNPVPTDSALRGTRRQGAAGPCKWEQELSGMFTWSSASGSRGWLSRRRSCPES